MRILVFLRREVVLLDCLKPPETSNGATRWGKQGERARSMSRWSFSTLKKKRPCLPFERSSLSPLSPYRCPVAAEPRSALGTSPPNCCCCGVAGCVSGAAAAAGSSFSAELLRRKSDDIEGKKIQRESTLDAAAEGRSQASSKKKEESEFFVLFV